MLVGWAIGVGLDWLPGLSGESWNGRRWPGCRRCPTIATSWAMVGDVGDSFRALCGRNSWSFTELSRIRRWVDMSMHGARLSLSLVGGIKGGKQLDQEAATLVGGSA